MQSRLSKLEEIVGKLPGSAPPASVVSAQAPEEDDDDDFDLFGSDEEAEESEEQADQRAAVLAKYNEKKSKSKIVLFRVNAPPPSKNSTCLLYNLPIPFPIVLKTMHIIYILYAYNTEAQVVAKSSILLDVKPVSVQDSYSVVLLIIALFLLTYSGMMKQVRERERCPLIRTDQL